MISDLIPARGRAQTLEFEIVRPLVATDLMRISEAPMAAVPSIQSIRPRHHQMAKLLAEGFKLTEIAVIVGTTPQRLTQLQSDPAFMELVSMYHDQNLSSYLDEEERVRGKVRRLQETALDVLLERVEDNPARMSDGNLLKALETGLDRTFMPPKTTAPANVVPAEITINIGGPLRDTQGEVAYQGSGPKVIEHRAGIEQGAEAKPQDPVPDPPQSLPPVSRP